MLGALLALALLAQGAAAKHAGTAGAARKALMADPPKCLKKSGFGHIALVSSGTWQGTIGEEPRTKINDSAFVRLYPSDKAAAAAGRKDSLAELAFVGGPFVVTATHASYLNQETSFAAACLDALTLSKRYSF